jgi:hypothetical protein
MKFKFIFKFPRKDKGYNIFKELASYENTIILEISIILCWLCKYGTGGKWKKSMNFLNP